MARPHGGSRQIPGNSATPQGQPTTGRVTGADLYTQQRMNALTTSPSSTRGMVHNPTHDADGGSGGLTTGGLNDQPTRVGGYGSMSHADAQAFHQQFGNEFDALPPEQQAQWHDHARQTNVANGYADDPAPAPGSPGGTSALQHFAQNGLSDTPPVRPPQAETPSRVAPTQETSVHSDGRTYTTYTPGGGIIDSSAQNSAAHAYDVTHPSRDTANFNGPTGPAIPVRNTGPLAPGSTDVVPNGSTKSNLQGTVTAGQNESGGDSGIKVDGKWVSHGADDASGRPTLVSAAPTTAPLSDADQRAKIKELYPQAAVAGSPANKQLVDAFHQGGSDTSTILDTAHALFASRSQAAVIAQDQTESGAAAAKTAADAQANLTPAQRQIVQQHQDANHAAVAAAGKSVYDPDNTAKTVGQQIGDAIEGGGIDAYTGYWHDKAQPVVNAARDLWNGISGNTDSTPAAPTPHAPAPVAPASNRMPDGSLGNNTPPAPTTAPARPADQVHSVDDGSLANVPGAVFTPDPPAAPAAPLSPSAPAATPSATSISAVDYFRQQGVPGTAPSVGAPSPSPNATTIATPPPLPNATGAPMTLPKQAGMSSFSTGPQQPPNPNGLPDDDEEEGSATAYFGKQKNSLFATA